MVDLSAFLAATGQLGQANALIASRQEDKRRRKEAERAAMFRTVGTVVGATLGSFLPGPGTVVGATIGNMAGGAAAGQPPSAMEVAQVGAQGYGMYQQGQQRNAEMAALKALSPQGGPSDMTAMPGQQGVSPDAYNRQVGQIAALQAGQRSPNPLTTTANVLSIAQSLQPSPPPKGMIVPAGAAVVDPATNEPVFTNKARVKDPDKYRLMTAKEVADLGFTAGTIIKLNKVTDEPTVVQSPPKSAAERDQWSVLTKEAMKKIEEDTGVKIPEGHVLERNATTGALRTVLTVPKTDSQGNFTATVIKNGDSKARVIRFDKNGIEVQDLGAAPSTGNIPSVGDMVAGILQKYRAGEKLNQKEINILNYNLRQSPISGEMAQAGVGTIEGLTRREYTEIEIGEIAQAKAELSKPTLTPAIRKKIIELFEQRNPDIPIIELIK